MNLVLSAADRRTLAAHAAELFYQRDPNAAQRYPPGAREICTEDVLMHLLYVDAAESVDSLDLLVDYLAWVRGLFSRLDLPVSDLWASLACLAEACELAGRQSGTLRRALAEIDRLPPDFSSQACAGAPLTGSAERYLSALLAWDATTAEKLVIAAVAGGTAIASIYLEVIAPAMREVGRLWAARRITVADEHYISSVTQVIMSRLYPCIFAPERRRPVLVATCVQGEPHEMGMRMVADLFQLDGWDTHFLGANTPPKAVVALADRTGAAMVALSATIVANVPAVASQVALLRAGPGGEGRKILVGGYPFGVDKDLWRRVGADGTAADGRQALAVANRLLGGAE